METLKRSGITILKCKNWAENEFNGSKVGHFRRVSFLGFLSLKKVSSKECYGSTIWPKKNQSGRWKKMDINPRLFPCQSSLAYSSITHVYKYLHTYMRIGNQNLSPSVVSTEKKTEINSKRIYSIIQVKNHIMIYSPYPFFFFALDEENPVRFYFFCIS